MHCKGGKALIAALIATASFADSTIAAAKTQTISIKTAPYLPGATCTVSSSGSAKNSFQPPASVTIKQGWGLLEVRCSTKCFEGHETISPALFGGYPPATIVSLKLVKGCVPKK